MKLASSVFPPRAMCIGDISTYIARYEKAPHVSSGYRTGLIVEEEDGWTIIYATIGAIKAEAGIIADRDIGIIASVLDRYIRSSLRENSIPVLGDLLIA